MATRRGSRPTDLPVSALRLVVCGIVACAMSVLGWQCLAVADPPSVANPFVAEMPDGLTDVNAVAANGDAVDVAKDEVDAAKRR